MKVSALGFFSWIIVNLSLSTIKGQTSIDINTLKEAKIIPFAEINTSFNESAPILIGQSLYYISDQKEGQFDLYSGTYKSGEITNLKILDKKFNSPQHEGSICECNENLYFTKSVKKYVNGVKTDGLQLMTKTKTDKKPRPLPTSKNLMHIACRGNSIYAIELGPNKMTSIVKIDENGTIIPEPSLSEVNSNSNEGFLSFIHENIMIFSSKKPGGYGGFDLYASANINNAWTRPLLLPAPFNTPFDDMSFSLFDNGRSGLIASNRPGGLGGDDLYFWATNLPILMYNKPIELVKFEINLVDKLTSDGIKDVYVKLYTVKNINSLDILKRLKIESLDGKDTVSTKTISNYVESSSILLSSNEQGQITTQLPSDQNFVIEILSGSYEKQYYLLTSEQWTKITDLTLPLSPIEIKNNNETERLEQNVDSELDSWVIRGISVLKNSINFSEDAKLQLDEIVSKMKTCENCNLEITAYSDSRGNTIQNLKKTEDQASTLKKWLSFKGVPQLNINTKGGGDSKILNQCTKGSICTQKDHDFNNRFEISLVLAK